jgi:hypothetical protein
MSAAANAAAFLSMRRRLPGDAGPKPHFPQTPVAAALPRPEPVRVAVLEPIAEQVAPVQVSYRKRRSILK